MSLLAAFLLCACTWGDADLEEARKLYARHLNNDTQAQALLIELASPGNPHASFFAGLSKDPLLNKSDPDVQAAVTYYLQARKTHGQASHNLALLSLAGVQIPADGDQALGTEFLLNEAAAKNIRESIMLLAALHESGTQGIRKNAALSAQWYEKLVLEYGEGWAQYKLGVAYLAGSGVKRDVEKGQELLTAAAQKGFSEALVELAMRSQDIVQKARWAATASLADPRYEKLSNALLGSLDQAHVEQIKEAATMWIFANRTEAKRISFTHPLSAL